MHFVLLLSAFLGVSSLALGMAPERKDRRGDESLTAEGVAPGTRPAWDFEVFARGGLATVPANGEVAWIGTVLDAPAPYELTFLTEASRSNREAAWGAGFRAMRGRWGFETQYLRIPTGAFQPGSLIQESALDPLRGLAPGGEPEDLLIAQGIFRFPITTGGAQLFIGFGGGYLRFPTVDASRREEILLTDFYAAEVEPRLQQSLSNRIALQQEQTGRSSFVVAGSAGITVGSGRFFVRPRVGVLLGRTRQTAASWDVAGEFDVPDAGRQWVDLGTESVEVSVRPLFVLFSVEAGWSTRR